MEIIQENVSAKIHIRTASYTSRRSLLHWHHNVEICQVLENRMCFLIAGEFVEAKEGDIIVIGENIVHEFLPQYGSTKICIMQFPLKLLVETGIPIKRCKVHISTQEMKQIPGLMQQVCMLFKIIEEEKDIVETNYFQQCIVSALYCLLTRYFSEPGKEDLTKEQKEFLHILQYINDHFEEDINVQTLAERLFMYRGRLSFLFKKYSCMSLNEYIYSLRIKKANELMNQGSCIIEAALQSGFQSVRTFNHVYKNITGITPKDYKKRGVSDK